MQPSENRVLIRAVELMEGGINGRPAIDYGDEDGDFMQIRGNTEDELDSHQEEETDGDEEEDNDIDTDDDEVVEMEEDEDEEDISTKIRRRRPSSQRDMTEDQHTTKRGQREGRRGRRGRRNDPGQGRGRRGRRRRNNRGSEPDML